MAGSKSDRLENEVLDLILGKATTDLTTASTAVINPSTLYVALLTIAYSDAHLPSDTGECTGSTYARVAITNSSNTWTNAASGAKENKAVIEFTTSAGSDWGTIKAFAIFNTNSTAVGADNVMLYGGDLTSNQVISSGNVVRFSTGAIDITED